MSIFNFEGGKGERVLVAGIDLPKKLVSETQGDKIFAISLENQWNQT